MKNIILSNGVVKQMSFEDVLKQFNPMLHRFANRAIDKIVFNKPEKEEIMQELRVQTWIAYDRYNGINAFSTYLVPRLKSGIHKATQKLYAQKRTNVKGSISLNETVNEFGEAEGELQAIVGEEDFEIVSLEFRELMKKFNDELDPCEKMMLRVLLEREDGYSVQDFADDMKMSRMGANKKINKFKIKVEKIIIDSDFVEV